VIAALAESATDRGRRLTFRGRAGLGLVEPLTEPPAAVMGTSTRAMHDFL
jgi:hypothetical protein